MTHIASPQNPRLKARAPASHAAASASARGTFLAEGEDLIARRRARRAPGARGLPRWRAPGSAMRAFTTSSPPRCAAVSTLGSGTRVIAVYEQRWGAPAGPLCVYLHGVGDPGNVGTVLRGAQAFGADCVALGPGCADPHSPEGGAREHGRDLRGRAGARQRRRRAARASASRWRADAPASAARADEDGEARPRRVTLLVGAEREGLPRDVLAACERGGADPDRLGLAERRDGGDRGAV